MNRLAKKIEMLTTENKSLQERIQSSEASLQGLRDENIRLLTLLSQSPSSSSIEGCTSSFHHSNPKNELSSAPSTENDGKKEEIRRQDEEKEIEKPHPSNEVVMEELRVCRRQRDELEIYLNHVLADLEDKTPLVEGMQKNYESLKHNYEQLTAAWTAALQYDDDDDE